MEKKQEAILSTQFLTGAYSLLLKELLKKYPINCERQKLHSGPNDYFFNQPTNMFMSAVHLDSLTHW